MYHNITPSGFFKNYDSELEYLCDQGIEELKSLNQIFDIAVGDSEYNVDCLKAYGYNKTDVVPIFLNFNINNQTYINKEIIYNIDRKSINFLFVGRIAPNKKFEDVIITFFYYHKYINNNSNLYLVGNIQFPIYYNQLIDLVKRLNISKSVFFTGSVNNDELEKYYSIAHIFLCMSEHEGFCVLY